MLIPLLECDDFRDILSNKPELWPGLSVLLLSHSIVRYSNFGIPKATEIYQTENTMLHS